MRPSCRSAPDASLDDLFAEAARHREHYVRVVSALSDAQLDMMIPFGGDRKVIDLPPTQVRLEDLLWAIALHDPNHTQDILRAISAPRARRSRLARELRFRPRSGRDHRAAGVGARVLTLFSDYSRINRQLVCNK